MKQTLIFFTLMLFMAGMHDLPAQNPFIRNYTSFDGLPSNTVYQVYQDSKKFIWFATDAGAARFDGTNFIYFSKQNGLSCNDVVHIKEDSLGRIWFFNMDATLNFYRDGVIYNTSNAPFLDSLKSAEFFRDFYEDTDHTIHFYYNYQRDVFALDSLNQVRKYKIASVISKGYPDGNPVETMVIRYLTKAGGWFYMWTISGLYKFQDFSQTPVLVHGSPGYKAVFPGRENKNIIVISRSEYNTFDIRITKDDFSVDTSIAPISPDARFVSDAIKDDNGYLWISTFDEGVDVYLGTRRIRHFDIKEAQAILQDHEKNIWITSLKEGVYKVSPYLNQHDHFESSKFDDHGILALAEHSKQGIWMTNGKDIYLLQQNEFLKLKFEARDCYLDQLLQTDDHTLVAGELSTNYYAFEGIRQDYGSNRIIYNRVSISPTPYKKLTLNRAGTEITTWNFFSLFRLKPRLFDHVQSYFLGERIFNAFYNSHDELIVNAKKIFLFENDSLIPANKIAAFDDKIISGHLVIEDSMDVFNIEGDSIFILLGDRLYNLSAAWKYPLDGHIKFMEYNSPTLFIGTSKSIYYCQEPFKIATGHPVVLRIMDIRFRNIHDILFSDGQLYIATDDGLTAISDFSFRIKKALPPIPYFHSIQVNELPESGYQPEVVLTGRNRILINFSSINYSMSPVIYSYKLEGLDDKWNQGIGKNVIYENLPKGDYVYKLRARKPNSAWSDPIEYRITIKATIWQHPVFYLILTIILAGLLLIFILWRKNAEIKRREVEHQLVLLEQRALQSMMNPHFIFNALGSIQNYLLQSKPIEAGRYLSQFARLIRQNLNASNAAMTNLEEEVDRLKNYLDLENMRMEKKFEYNITIDKSIASHQVQIPSMIIQPFVENSIWHGISNMDGKGQIVISFILKDERSIRIIVEDNGTGIKNAGLRSARSEKHLKMGMAMTSKRLDLLGKKFNLRTGIEISEAYPGSAKPGTHIEIVAPVSYDAENRIME